MKNGKNIASDDTSKRANRVRSVRNKDKKHPCPDCQMCQWCSDSRCAACQGWKVQGVSCTGACGRTVAATKKGAA